MPPVVYSQVFNYTPANAVTQEAATICTETLSRNSKGIIEYNGVTYFLNGPQYASTGILVGASSPTELAPTPSQLRIIKQRHANNQCANL